MADIQNWLDLVIVVLGIVVGFCLLMAARRVELMIEQRVGSEQVRTVLLQLNDAVFDAVGEIKQSVVDDLKESAADGKLTGDEARRVANSAKKKVLEYLPGEAVERLKDIFALDATGIDEMVERKIERAVASFKDPPKPTTNTEVHLNGQS